MNTFASDDIAFLGEVSVKTMGMTSGSQLDPAPAPGFTRFTNA